MLILVTVVLLNRSALFSVVFAVWNFSSALFSVPYAVSRAVLALCCWVIGVKRFFSAVVRFVSNVSSGKFEPTPNDVNEGMPNSL